MNDLLLAAATALGGVATGGLVYLAVRRRRPAKEPSPSDEVVPLEVVEETLVVPVRRDAAPAFDDAPFSVTAPASTPPRAPRVPVAATPAPGGGASSVPFLATHAPRRPALVLNRGGVPTYDPDDPPELPDSPIPTEWARRLIGHPESGRMKGLCSGCGTHLSVSQARPVRIACPVCGRTRLLGS